MAHRMNFHPLCLILLAAVLAPLVGCNNNSNAAEASDTQNVTIAGRTFELELALDNDARHQGLGGRESIPEDGGMLFVFPGAAQLQFIMRDCLVPIDLIYVGPSGRVVATHQMKVEPPGTPDDEMTRYPSRWPAQFAIELRGGALDEIQVSPGDKVEMPLEALKRRAR